MEKTEKGDNICQKCGDPKVMYYYPWCPRCDKPKAKATECFNFIKCCIYIENVLKVPGYKDRMWDLLQDTLEFRNDCLLWWPIAEIDLDDNYEEKEERKDVDLFIKTFNLGKKEEVLLEFSW